MLMQGNSNNQNQPYGGGYYNMPQTTRPPNEPTLYHQIDDEGPCVSLTKNNLMQLQSPIKSRLMSNWDDRLPMSQQLQVPTGPSTQNMLQLQTQNAL